MLKSCHFCPFKNLKLFILPRNESGYWFSESKYSAILSSQLPDSEFDDCEDLGEVVFCVVVFGAVVFGAVVGLGTVVGSGTGPSETYSITVSPLRTV